jgi:hypothetical protein
MPARLGHNSLAGVDENNGQVRGGSSGHHVARVLLVARSVGDDEFAFQRSEIAIGNVDGNPLLALRLQAVGEQGQIQTVQASAPGRALYGGKLIFENGFRIVQQPPDQRAFAVIDAARGNE